MRLGLWKLSLADRYIVRQLLASLGLALTSLTVTAEDHPYTEGTIINVAAIRTEYGRWDDYLQYLDTTWKAEQEAAKKAGYITGYKVVNVEPRGENDPDIYLVVYYKNWVAHDKWTLKGDTNMKQVVGSMATAKQGAVDRGKMRRILGSWTGQELSLK